ncbi:fructose-1-phosphate kinase [Salsuginibacillus halophilus]|uniref:Tagatose-6-phosphate kinase n=1 Tax=Salsuginibacillus halophilus TaxID=517424 RepID=A0A2P8HQW2_9BACI|nr:1-phosphofructokinase [Salsuginibacillus halophilus]PSL48613.1 fructose-1-phosphate kinase [Salsuginibacillus halophilus]
MIYTVTLNPALDYIVSLDALTTGSVNRAHTEQKEPGGKGINVSRMLHNLGEQSTALGFAGGFSGDWLTDRLTREGIQTSFTPIEDDTRINVKVKEQNETEINAPSPAISEAAQAQLQDQLSRVTTGDTVVFAGSVPQTLPQNIYETMILEAKSKGAYICLDASGEAFQHGLKAVPDMAKPNQHELEELFNCEIRNISDAAHYAEKLQTTYGINHVLVSLAGEGAVLVTQDGALHARPPAGALVNSVGAGDSSVAGFLAAQLASASVHGTLAYSVASGSATAFSDGFGAKADVEKLAEEVKITDLS